MGLFKFVFQRWAKLQHAVLEHRHRSQLQSFILEPILTPSGLVDGFEEISESLDLDPLPFEDNHFEPDSEMLAAGIDNPIAPEPLEPIAFIDNLDTTEVAANLTTSTFDSGIFTVGESAQVNIDFLFDGVPIVANSPSSA